MNLLLLMAQSWHRKADILRIYFDPTGDDVTVPPAPGQKWLRPQREVATAGQGPSRGTLSRSLRIA